MQFLFVAFLALCAVASVNSELSKSRFIYNVYSVQPKTESEDKYSIIIKRCKKYFYTIK